VVRVPATKDRVAAPTARMAPAVVQVSVSTVVPAAPTHVQVVVVPVKVLTLVESTAVKYPLGTETMTWPPMGRAVAVVKPSVIAPVFRVLGALSPEVAKAISTPLVSWPPRDGSATSPTNGWSRMNCPAEAVGTDCAYAAGMSSRIAANKGAQ